MIARLEVTGRHPTAAAEDQDAFSITEFCQRNRISVPLYYKLRKQGLGPAEFRMGARVLISKEAAAAWRREREAATAAAI